MTTNKESFRPLDDATPKEMKAYLKIKKLLEGYSPKEAAKILRQAEAIDSARRRLKP